MSVRSAWRGFRRSAKILFNVVIMRLLYQENCTCEGENGCYICSPEFSIIGHIRERRRMIESICPICHGNNLERVCHGSEERWCGDCQTMV